MTTITSGHFRISITNSNGAQKLADPQGYVEMVPNENFGVFIQNLSRDDVSATISINGDVMGSWILRPRKSATIYNPDPNFATGLFKAVAKSSEYWEVGGMNEVAEDDRGVVSVSFQTGLIDEPKPQRPKYVERSASFESYGSLGGERTRGGAKESCFVEKSISSGTHENAGVVLEGDNKQSFGSIGFTAFKEPPTIIEARLVIRKATAIKPTRQRNVNRPPSL